MGAEYELKYRAEETVQRRIEEDYPQGWETVTMETTYYNTPSASLSARRYTLRRRFENGISVCTLKAPGKGAERGEWEVRCETIEAAIPELCKLGCPADLEILCAEGLVPICGAAFTRHINLLDFPGGKAELALDKGRLFGGGKECPLCEIELELKDGSNAALDAFGAEFAAKYGLQTEHRSKFARALALGKED